MGDKCDDDNLAIKIDDDNLAIKSTTTTTCFTRLATTRSSCMRH